MRDIYQDEDVIAIVDEDGDGKISDEEKKKFESYVKSDKEKLELDDLKQALKDIKNEKFDTDKYKNYEVPETTLEDLSETDKINSPSSASGASGGGGGGGGGGGATKLKTVEKTLDFLHN